MATLIGNCSHGSSIFAARPTRGLTGFAYFKNDVNSHAPLNALRLMAMVGKYALRLFQR